MYAPIVQDEDMAFYVFSARSQGYYDYKLYPEGQREFYIPIEQVVPYEKYPFLIGYDFAVQDVVMESIIKARDSNTVVSTNIHKIRGTDTLGFYIISPIYQMNSARGSLDERRKNFQGVLLLEIDAKVFVEQAIDASNSKEQKTVSFPSDTTIVFEVFAYDKDGNYQSFYQSDNFAYTETNYKVAVSDTVAFRFADKEIYINFATVPDFGGKFQNAVPNIIFASAIALSIMIFGFLFSLITSKARAQDLADRMTRSQRRIVDSSQDIIAITDLAGVWKSMNPASINVFGFAPEDMLNTRIDELLFNDKQREAYSVLLETEQDEQKHRIDLQMKDSKGSLKWISWDFTVSRTEGLIYSIGRDITLEKLAENKAKLRAKQIELAEIYAREASENKSFFMKKLSHHLRNSLTGVIGYLDLIANKVYESQEELDEYALTAQESSEEIFNFISDIVDVALVSDKYVIDPDILTLDKIIESSQSVLESLLNEYPNIIIDKEDRKSHVFVEPQSAYLSFAYLIYSLNHGNEGGEIQIYAQENIQEGATEIQILAPYNSIVAEMIELYKNNKNNLIEVLKQDKRDILLRFAVAASLLRKMSGNISLESLGQNDGNLASISLPLNKRIV
jgi:PAS domain S-box-containing protein